MDHISNFMKNCMENTREMSRDELIARHMEAIKGMILPRSERKHATTVTFTTPFASRKPTNITPRNMDQYKPIYVSNLMLETTHKGRVLRGRVVTPPLVMTSIMTIIEDETGAIVKIAVYNALPEDLDLRAKTAAAQEFLKEGTVVAIIDPFYKTFMDLSRGIRIDDPLELIFMDDMGSKTPIDLRCEGNDQFKSKNYAQATQLYTRALQVVDDKRLLSSLFCNMANAVMRMSTTKHEIALLYSTAALAIDAGYEKARMRQGLAFGSNPLAMRCKELGTHLDVAVAVSNALSSCFADVEARICNPPSSSEAALTALELKAQGNDHFNKGAFDEACRFYALAITSLNSSHSVALILSNRSICNLQLALPVDALVDALAAICCDPRFVKGHLRRSAALLTLDKLPEAGDAAACGLSLDPGSVPLLEMKERVANAVQADSVITDRSTANENVIKNRMGKMKVSYGVSATVKVPSETELLDKKESECASTSSVSMLNAMIEMASKSMVKGSGKGKFPFTLYEVPLGAPSGRLSKPPRLHVDALQNMVRGVL